MTLHSRPVVGQVAPEKYDEIPGLLVLKQVSQNEKNSARVPTSYHSRRSPSNVPVLQLVAVFAVNARLEDFFYFI